METTLEWNGSDKTGAWLAGSVLLHVAIAGAIAAFAFIHPSADRWGENSDTTGAIQASIVSSLPLPRPPVEQPSVLATDQPSPSPIQTKTATVEQPQPKAIPIPVKAPPKPPKVAEKTSPAVEHPQPVKAPPNKAVTGESPGIQVPQAVQQLDHGTASATIQDRNFGDRFAWYGRLIEQKVAQNWYSAQVDAGASNGKKVTLLFVVNRDGVPSGARIQTSSGSPSLDRSALLAIQRTEGFGPLPAGGGDHLTVEYTFEYHR